jgi:hypothetical protein
VALDTISREDEQRRQWSLKMHGVDTCDPSLYDLVIHVSTLSVADAVSLIAQAAQLKQFEATPESRAALDDRRLAAHVRARLVDDFPMAAVSCTAGVVTVDVRLNITDQPGLPEMIQQKAQEGSEGREVRLTVHSRVPF